MPLFSPPPLIPQTLTRLFSQRSVLWITRQEVFLGIGKRVAAHGLEPQLSPPQPQPIPQNRTLCEQART